MENRLESIQQYAEQENIWALDELLDTIVVSGTKEEKQACVEGYEAYIHQCYYDHACGKFNELDEILSLLTLVDHIHQLDASFEEYHFHKGCIFEMTSEEDTSKEEKLKWMEKSLYHFQQQSNLKSEVQVLLAITRCMLEEGRINNDFNAKKVDDVLNVFLEAFHLERKQANTNYYTNGNTISSILNVAYEFLFSPMVNGKELHEIILTSFKRETQKYVVTQPIIYYHWVDTLIRITERWKERSELGDIWGDIEKYASKITHLDSEQEGFLTTLGHLFTKIAKRKNSLLYFEISLNYFLKAIELNNTTWYNPHYASSVLKEIALIHIQGKREKEAQIAFKEGREIFEKVYDYVDHFQFHLQYGEYLYEYAKYVERFENEEILLRGEIEFEKSKQLGKDFYTGPYYGLIKVALRLKQNAKAFDLLYLTGEVFSSEYHVHDFNEIITDDEFEEVQDEIPKVMDKVKKNKEGNEYKNNI